MTLAVDRQATGWHVMLPTALIFVVLGALNGLQLGSTSAMGWSMLSALLAAALLWVALIAAHKSVLRIPFITRHPGIAIVIIGIAIWVIDLVVFRSITALSGESADLWRADQSIAVWLVQTTVLLFVTAIWAGLHDYRVSLAKEHTLQEQLSIARQEAIAGVQQQREDVMAQVTMMLDDALVTVGEPANVTNQLRDLARERIRPLSHELANALPPYEAKRPEVSREATWHMVAMNVSASPLIRPFAMAILVTIMFVWQAGSLVTTSADGVTTGADVPIDTDGISVTLDTASMLWSLLYLVLVFLATWLTGVAAIRITRKIIPGLGLGGRLIVAVLTLFAIVIVVQVVVQIALLAPGSEITSVPNQLQFASALPIFALAFVVLLVRAIAALLVAAQRTQQELSAALAWESARAHETLVQERRHMASVLHGSLQSKVAATALEIEHAHREGQAGVAIWDQAQHELVTVVQSLADGPPEQRDLAAELLALTSTWAGLCEVDISLDPDLVPVLARDWVSAGTLSDLLTEAVANAVIHAQATHVRVGVAEESGATMRILVVDDGTQSEISTDFGLGSQQLDEVAIAWSRDVTPEGTQLKVVLPAPR